MSIIQVCNWTSLVINNNGGPGIRVKEEMLLAPQHDGVNGCHDQQTNGIHLFSFTYVTQYINVK